MAVRELTSTPNLALLFAKGMATSRTGGEDLPDDELVLRDVTVDRDHLAAYNHVCGYALRDELPLTYPHVLAFPLSIALMADRRFPFPLPGLVHITNRIVRHRALDAAEPLTLHVRAADLRPHEKGKQFDVITTAEVGGDVVWVETSTYLRRGGGSGGDGDRPRMATPDLAPTARWRLPGDIGRRYGAVSGDRNPIHLNRLTARPFGFSRPIANGMWTKARCLAALGPRLPASATADVAFKRPILLPSSVRFASAQQDGAWVFTVTAEQDGTPHLVGEAKPADRP